MLKKFLKEYLLLVIILMLLGLAGVTMIFLGAFIDVSIYAKYFLVIAGLACTVGSISAWFISLYEFEKLEMLIQIKDELVKDERN